MTSSLVNTFVFLAGNLNFVECAFRKAPQPLHPGLPGEFRAATRYSALRSLSFILSHPSATHPAKMSKKRISPYFQAEKDEIQVKCDNAYVERWLPFTTALGFEPTCLPLPAQGSTVDMYEYKFSHTDGLFFDLDFPVLVLVYERYYYDGKKWRLTQRVRHSNETHLIFPRVNG